MTFLWRFFQTCRFLLHFATCTVQVKKVSHATKGEMKPEKIRFLALFSRHLVRQNPFSILSISTRADMASWSAATSFFLGGSVSLLGHLPFLHRWAPFCGMPLFAQLRAFRTSLTRCTWKRKWMHQRMRLVQPCKVSITRVHHRRLTEAYIGHEKLAHQCEGVTKSQPVIALVLQETASLWLELRVMLDIPSQYMHYCLVLLCEVYCVIV